MDRVYLRGGGKNEDYKEYLKEVCYYEKNLYFIDLSIQRLKEKMSDLGAVSYIEKPRNRTRDSKTEAFPVFCAGAVVGVFPIFVFPL